jgi:hypothetical protein
MIAAVPNFWVRMDGSTKAELEAKRSRVRDLVRDQGWQLVDDDIFYERETGHAFFLVRGPAGRNELGPLHDAFSPHHVIELHTVDELD